MSLNVRLTTPSTRPAAAWAVSARSGLLALLGSRAWLLALLMVALGALAYRVPYRSELKIGGAPPVTPECYTVALFDWPYLLGFNADPEFLPPEDCANARAAYRWAFGNAAIVVPGIGRAPQAFSLSVLQGQPELPIAPSSWSANGEPLLTVPIEQAPRVYTVLLPPGDGVDVAFRTPAYQGPNDPRELAFAVDRAWSEPLARAAPAWGTLLPLSLMVALVYAGMRRAAMSERWATAAGVGLIGALAALLAFQRTSLTLLAAQRLPWLLLGATLLLVLLAPLAAGLARRLGLNLSAEARTIAGLIALAWLIRCLGLLHPQALSSDIGLNENNLKGTIQGYIFSEENLPEVAGGGSAPYPPAQYVMLQPLALLWPDYRGLLIVGNALIDSLVIGALWLCLRSAGYQLAAAGFAAALYLFATPLLASMSIGEMANVWGQALATFAIVTLVLWRERRALPIVALCVLAAALLGHFGVLASLALFLALWGLLLLGRRPGWLRYALVVAGAGAAAFVLYYSQQLGVILEMPPAPAPTNSLLQRIGYQLDDLWRPAGLIGPPVALLGLAGAVLAWRRSPALGLLLAAWWAAAVVSWATLLWSQQALRWEAFVYPAAALGGGVALGELWRRGWPSRVLGCALLAVALTLGAVLWVQRIATYGH